MPDANELKEVEILLPAYLIDLFTSQAEYTGRSFNDELVKSTENLAPLHHQPLGEMEQRL